MTTEQIPSVVLPRFLLDGHGAELAAVTMGREDLVPEDEVDALEESLPSLQVLVTGIEDELFERLIEAPRLRWVHSISAGVEHLPLARLAKRRILLTNSAVRSRPPWSNTRSRR